MSKPLVLIIDDERYFLLLVKEMIEDAGYDVVTSNDVEEGVRVFYEKKPALVVMDIVMPKEFGTQVCKDLKETPQGKDTPIILMSSGVKEMAEEEGLIEYKADEYILKPFDQNVFLGLLKKHIDKDLRKTVSFSQPDVQPESTEKDKLGIDLFDLKDIKPYDGKGRAAVGKGAPSKGKGEDPVRFSQGEGGLIIMMTVNEDTKGIFTGNPMMNVRSGGVFVTAEHPASLGTKVEFKFGLPDGELEVKGMVVWMQPANPKTGQKAGMGIRFSDQKSEAVAKVKEFVKNFG